MKNYNLILLLLVFVFVNHTSRSQTISNGGFENWSFQTYFENPVGFSSTNFSSYIINRSGNINKISPGFNSANAISLQSVDNNPDVLPGFAFLTNPSSNPASGIPYAGRPDSLSGFFKCDIQPGDTGNVTLLISGGGSILGFAQKLFIGQTNNWTPFGVSFIWLDTITPPDTLAAILSSSAISGASSVVGSRLDLDQLTLIGTNAAPFPNGDFELWVPTGNNEPDSWSTVNFVCDASNLSVTESADAYAGSSALQLKTIVIPFGDTIGIMTNGYFAAEPEGGMPITQNPVSITGYYKYFPQGPDTAIAAAYTYAYNPATQTRTVLDSTLTLLPPTSTYQSFTLPFLYNGWNLPDTINITFGSSNFYFGSNFIGVGSVLLIDELSIQYSPVGEPQPLFGASASPFPVPASSWLTIPLDKVLNGATIEIIDARGKSIFQSKITGTRLQLDVHNWSDGVYFYRCIGNGHQAKGQFIVQH